MSTCSNNVLTAASTNPSGHYTAAAVPPAAGHKIDLHGLPAAVAVVAVRRKLMAVTPEDRDRGLVIVTGQ